MNRVFFLLLMSVKLLAVPNWYYKLSSEKPNFYIGYGSGASEKEAKQSALGSISSQISVKIDSKTEQSKKLVDGRYERDIIQKSSQKTKANLSGYELIKVELEEEKYFVAIGYENIPSIDKFLRKLKALELKDEKQSSFISKTYIGERLKKLTGKSLNFALLRKDEKWYIKYKDILQVLDKKDFNSFFATSFSDKISIKTDKKNSVLYDGDEFYFKVKTAQKGFVSILTVYEDGTVASLVKNVPVKKGKTENIPDIDYEQVPQAGLIKSGEETFDMYVALFSKKKLLFDRFAQADDETVTDERYKNFDELIDFLDDKVYATLKVITKPR